MKQQIRYVTVLLVTVMTATFIDAARSGHMGPGMGRGVGHGGMMPHGGRSMHHNDHNWHGGYRGDHYGRHGGWGLPLGVGLGVGLPLATAAYVDAYDYPENDYPQYNEYDRAPYPVNQYSDDYDNGNAPIEGRY